MRHQILQLIGLAMPAGIVGGWVYTYANRLRRQTHIRTSIADHLGRRLPLLGTIVLIQAIWPWSRVGDRVALAVDAALAIGGLQLAAFVAGAWRRGLYWPGRRTAPRAVAGILLGLALFALVQYGQGPCAASAVQLSPPLERAWYVSQGGPTLMTNLHALAPAQRHAVDLVRLGPDGLSHRGLLDLTSFHAWGEPVYAPVAGTVVSAASGHPDMPPGERDRRDPRGNHVLIETADGIQVLLAHLQQGSVTVQRGAHVGVGQLLGRIGNSGITSEPHLHLGVMQLDGGRDVGVPFVIADGLGPASCLRKDQRLEWPARVG